MVLESLESYRSPNLPLLGTENHGFAHASATVGAKLRVTSSVGKTAVAREAAASGAEVTNIDGRIIWGDHLGVTWGGLPSDNLLKLSYFLTNLSVLFLVDFQKESQQSDELPQSV